MSESKPVATAKPKASGLALFGLVIGLVGLGLSLTRYFHPNRDYFLNGWGGLGFGLVAIICGILANPNGRWSVILAAVAIGFLNFFVAMAVPNFAVSYQHSPLGTCINNLRQIDGAKQEWALENRKERTDTPTPAELDKLLENGFKARQCPLGGVYTINPVGKPPTCSIPGHVSP